MSASVRMASRSIILLSQPLFRLELDRILSKCLASPKIERIGLVRPPHIADDDRRKLPPARLADRPRKAEGQPAPARARRDAVARPRPLARRRAGSRPLDGDPRSGRAGHRHSRSDEQPYEL